MASAVSARCKFVQIVDSSAFNSLMSLVIACIVETGWGVFFVTLVHIHLRFTVGLPNAIRLCEEIKPVSHITCVGSTQNTYMMHIHVNIHYEV